MHKESFEDIAIDYNGLRPDQAVKQQGAIRITEDNVGDDDSVLLTFEEAQFLVDTLPSYIDRIANERNKPQNGEIFHSSTDGTYLRIVDSWNRREITEQTPFMRPGETTLPSNATEYKVSVLAKERPSNLSIGTTAWIDEDAIKDKCERVTSNRSLAFLNAGRVPDEWKPGDIRENVNTGEVIVVSETDVGSHRSLLKQSAPICFVENRVDY